MDDKTLTMSLLYDFYGELLTEKQREYFDLYYNDDLSLSEIAELSGISRQGVRDNIVRAENTLKEFEEKTGLIKRFSEIQSGLNSIQKDIDILSEKITDEEGRKIADSILVKLQDLKG